MKRIICLLLVAFSLMCQAARQEDNINQMVTSLHHELVLKWKEIKANRTATDRKMLELDTLISNCDNNSKQCAMTVYSTDDNSFQDVAFANQNALRLCNSFGTTTAPYTTMLRFYEQTTHRQDSLMMVLTSIDGKTLNAKEKKLLPEAISILANIQQYNRGVLKRLQALRPIYIASYKRLMKVKGTCQQKYGIIRSNVLYDFNDNIFDILSDWDGYMYRKDKSMEQRWSVDDSYMSKGKNIVKAFAYTVDEGAVSAWGVMRIVGMFILIVSFVIIAFVAALAVCVVRWIIKRLCMLQFWSRTRLSRLVNGTLHAVTRLSGAKTFSIVLFWVNVLIWAVVFYSDNTGEEGVADYVASEIMYFSFLLAVIVTFFILRYSGRQLWTSLAVCVPTLLAFLYSLFSIIMVMPDSEIVVEATFVSVILFALQLLIYCRCHRHLDDSMKRISTLSLVFCGVSMITALVGLQFLSLMVDVFWCSFMVCMILLTSLKQYLDKMIAIHNLGSMSVKRTWWIPVLNRVLYPMAWIYTALWSCKIACSAYSLNGVLNQLLNTYFSTPLGNISININLLIFICWNILLAAYISKIAYQFVDYYHKSRGDTNWKDTSFFNQSIIRTIVWGVAIINIMIQMGFNLQWIGYCMAGLSTGLGFASREIIENLIYGLTLRNGQLKIGDWIICQGIRGQIKSIGLLSTRMDSVEGSVFTFTNGSLLKMNFENITLNHGYELLHTNFCVNYGEDLDRLRQLLIDGYKKYDCYDQTRPVTVYVKKITDNQIDLDFRAWVLAADRIKIAAFNQEYVYNVLHENGIKYPLTRLEIDDVTNK